MKKPLITKNMRKELIENVLKHEHWKTCVVCKNRGKLNHKIRPLLNKMINLINSSHN